MTIPGHVEHPDAWARAREARIKANGNLTRRRALDAAIANDPAEFRYWLFSTTPPELQALCDASQTAYDMGDDEHHPACVAYRAAYRAWQHRLGTLPAFLRESLDEWGGLTAGQLAFARRAYAERVTRAEGRDAAEAQRRANAPAWVAGRQGVTGTVVSVRVQENDFGGTSFKGLVALADGRKLWSSLPRDLVWQGIDASLNQGPRTYDECKGLEVAMTVTVEPKPEDPTFAFGSRPKLGLPTPKTPRARRVRSTPTEG